RRQSFTDLVNVACPNVDPQTLLEQLIAAGSVEVTDSQTVRCVSRAYVPKGADDSITRIERVGRYLSAHAANFVHNLLRKEDEPVYLERVVVSDEVLTDRSRDAFFDHASQKGQELLSELDAFLTHFEPTPANTAGKKYGLGIFFFD